MIRLNREWTELFDRYRADHQDQRNQLCHQIGIPLIGSSVPVAFINLPAGATMMVTGWFFQFLGHYFEGKKPSFVSDKRSVIIGALWCMEKYGLKIHQEAV